jgi:hypothetical protein
MNMEGKPEGDALLDPLQGMMVSHLMRRNESNVFG